MAGFRQAQKQSTQHSKRILESLKCMQRLPSMSTMTSSDAIGILESGLSWVTSSGYMLKSSDIVSHRLFPVFNEHRFPKPVDLSGVA